MLNKKEIRCCNCDNLVDFREDLYDKEELIDTLKNPTSDSINLICPVCNMEDDASHLYVVFKDGSEMGMEDFYRDYTSFFEETTTDEKLCKEFNYLKNRRKR
jgi:hypothetical protein